MVATEPTEANRLCYRKIVQVSFRAIIDDAAILRRAKELCQGDRLAWDYSAFVASRGRRGLKGVLDEEARRDTWRGHAHNCSERAALPSPHNRPPCSERGRCGVPSANARLKRWQD